MARCAVTKSRVHLGHPHCTTGESCQPSRAGNSQQEDSLNTKRPQLRQQTSLIQLLGISTLSPHPCSTEQDRKQISVTALQRPALFLSIDHCFRISCTFLSSPHLLHWASAPLLGFSPALGFGPTFELRLRIGFQPRIYYIGLRPHVGLRPCIGIRPYIYCIGLWPYIYYIGLQPYIGLRPYIYCIGLRPYIYYIGLQPYIGLRPCIYCIEVLTLHRASGPAFTASRF
ncbi:hypothetical protein CDL15_Pgr011636 [Punica granatum]|uniref:Uncharacterized protein n=1 Tax=Punica granatum TaxID=22663 RepID=A0A218XIG3_PUNGR|nr:hypothetical protein CDL15_Pgr011636 [Punica granatum]